MTVIAVADPAAAFAPTPNQIGIAALLTQKKHAGDQVTASTSAVASQLTGGTIGIQSNRDAVVQGSTIVCGQRPHYRHA